MLIRRASLVASSLMFVACGSSAPPPAAPPPTPAADPAPAGPDAQSIAPDEYIVTNSALGETWTSTLDGYLAKLEKQGEKGSDSLFYVVAGSGREMKSKFFYKSHIASKDELRPGVVVACSWEKHDGKENLFEAPTPNGARQIRWYVSHVTDVAELSKGVVHVGTAKCATSGVRVLVAAQ